MPDTVNEYVVSYFNELYNERGEVTFDTYKDARTYAICAKNNSNLKDVSFAKVEKTVWVLPEREWYYDNVE